MDPVVVRFRAIGLICLPLTLLIWFRIPGFRLFLLFGLDESFALLFELKVLGLEFLATVLG